MMYNHGVGLALPVETLIRLLIKLQTVIEAKPNDVMPAILQVKAVAATCGLEKQQIDFTSIPIIFLLFALIHFHSQMCSFQGPQQPLTIMLEIVANNSVLTVELFHCFQKNLYLAVMYIDHIFLFVIASTIAQLQ